MCAIELRRSHALVITACLLMPLGCAGADDRRVAAGPAVGVRDSAGIQIIEYSLETLMQRSGWRVSDVPDLEIGRGEQAQEQFYRIGTVVGLPSGAIGVLDQSAQELRLFDSRGRYVRGLGRKGDGPGEFRSANLLRPVSDTSLLFYDPRHARLTEFTAAGKLNHTRPFRSAGGVPIARAGSDQFVVHDRGVSAALLRRTDDGTVVHSSKFAVHHLTEGPGDPVVDASITNLFFAYRTRGGGEVLPIPFTTEPYAAAASAGFWISDVGDPELWRYDGPTPRMVIRVVNAPKVTIEQWQAAVKRTISGMTMDTDARRRVESLYEAHARPANVPLIQRVLVDDQGNAWLQYYRSNPEEAVTWMVISDAGRAIGSIVTPASLELHHAGVDYVLGVVRDAEGVERVVRHRLNKERP